MGGSTDRSPKFAFGVRDYLPSLKLLCLEHPKASLTLSQVLTRTAWRPVLLFTGHEPDQASGS